MWSTIDNTSDPIDIRNRSKMQKTPNIDVNTAAASTTATCDNPLMTQKALSLSLSPPRAPPFGTIQRAIFNHNSSRKNQQETKLLYEQLHSWWRSSQYSDDQCTANNATPLVRPHPIHNRNDYQVRPNNNATKKAPKVSTHPILQRRFLQRQHLQQCDEDSTSLTRRHARLKNNNYRYPRQHPHILQQSNDRVTRYLFGLGHLLSLDQQNYWRDAGIFRSIVDVLASSTIPPLLLISHRPSTVLFPFLRLMHICQTIPYGPDTAYQYIHLYPSPQLPMNTRQQRRLIVFVHGGAWGSGQPWMYRLIAAPFLFRCGSDDDWSMSKSPPQQSLTPYCYSVAVIGHRTYPDGPTLQEQVSDVQMALNVLIEQYSHLYDHSNITIVGHSSGAHVALCMVVDYIKEKLNALQQKVDVDVCQPNERIPVVQSLPFDSFCGISGPYDISHHFDYESARGVQELSPMKPVNGHTREAFRFNSPVLRLTNDVLMHIHPNVESQLQQICPKIALLHGIEDDTVPFTATAEAARLLRMVGMCKVQEIYVPHTGHQDAILQCMLGGRTSNALLEWISNLQNSSSDANRQKITKFQSRL